MQGSAGQHLMYDLRSLLDHQFLRIKSDNAPSIAGARGLQAANLMDMRGD